MVLCLMTWIEDIETTGLAPGPGKGGKAATAGNEKEMKPLEGDIQESQDEKEITGLAPGPGIGVIAGGHEAADGAKMRTRKEDPGVPGGRDPEKSHHSERMSDAPPRYQVRPK